MILQKTYSHLSKTLNDKTNKIMDKVNQIYKQIVRFIIVIGMAQLSYWTYLLSKYFEVEKPKTLTEKVKEYRQEAFKTAYDEFHRAVTLENEYINIVITVIVAMILCILTLIAIMKLVAGSTRRITGCCDFRGESKMPGSEFTRGKHPSYQVEIFKIGRLMDTFLGFGLRYKEVLAVPRHVIRDQTQLKVKGTNGSVLIDVSPVGSDLISDLVYISLKPKVWSVIGAKSFNNTNPTLTAKQASCCGLEGYSIGKVSAARTPYILTYTGSTISGMSGAAYYAGSQAGEVLGMHLGTDHATNIGVTVHVLTKEIDSIMWGEDSEDVNVLKLTSGPKIKPSWTIEDIDKRLAGHKAPNYDEILEEQRATGGAWADMVGEGPSNRPIKLASLVLNPQGKDQLQEVDLQVYTVHPEEDPLTQKRLGDIIRDLEEFQRETIKRLDKIEAKVFPKLVICRECQAAVNDIREHLKQMHSNIKCLHCKKQFFNSAAVQQHMMDKHATLVKTNDIEMSLIGESAVPSDSQRTTTSFLGERPPSPRTKPSNSRKASKSSDQRRESKPTGKNPRAMEKSQTDLNEVLKALQQVMVGLNSVAQRKSDL